MSAIITVLSVYEKTGIRFRSKREEKGGFPANGWYVRGADRAGFISRQAETVMGSPDMNAAIDRASGLRHISEMIKLLVNAPGKSAQDLAERIIAVLTTPRSMAEESIRSAIDEVMTELEKKSSCPAKPGDEEKVNFDKACLEEIFSRVILAPLVELHRQLTVTVINAKRRGLSADNTAREIVSSLQVFDYCYRH